MQWTASLLVCFALLQGGLSNSLENLRCLICQQVVKDLRQELKNVDPKKMLDVGNYRVNESPDRIPYAMSSLHISESLEKACSGIDDYVRATDKRSGELLLLRLILKEGGMNPKMSEVDIIQDGDLNKSLRYYCDEVAEDNEELITELFQKGESHIEDKLCRKELKLCSNKLEEIDQDDVRDEL